ncbi:MAG: hypothetical protein IC227_03605 [Enterococcus lacertideformus]|uniref:Uncharacterized protein n=1 Tax=Enterococcus lacertideformus TaxID=2771493 RepID=A0A931AVJ5_9ENTE|nr:hypothetical protein [Enterococcus lacertideformus]
MACPPIQNIYDILSVNGSIFLDLSDIFLNQQILENGLEKKLLICPRVKIQSGENNMVITRKKMLIETDFLLENCSDLIQLQVKLFKLLKDHKFPQEFYMRVFPIDMSLSQSNLLKPQYVNINSPLLLKLFKHITENGKYITIEEPMPSLKDYESDVCSEYVLESTI